MSWIQLQTNMVLLDSLVILFPVYKLAGLLEIKISVGIVCYLCFNGSFALLAQGNQRCLGFPINAGQHMILSLKQCYMSL